MDQKGQKKLLKDLPAKFHEILHPETVEKTKKVWEDFWQLYNVISDWTPGEDQVLSFHSKAIEWGKQLLNMTGDGYAHTCPITPYIHLMIYHVPVMLQKYETMKIFTGQGVEKKNDDFRRYLHRRINRWDTCKSLLMVEKGRRNWSHGKGHKEGHQILA